MKEGERDEVSRKEKEHVLEQPKDQLPFLLFSQLPLLPHKEKQIPDFTKGA